MIRARTSANCITEERSSVRILHVARVEESESLAVENKVRGTSAAVVDGIAGIRRFLQVMTNNLGMPALRSEMQRRPSFKLGGSFCVCPPGNQDLYTMDLARVCRNM
jgi:hypothetical protein